MKVRSWLSATCTVSGDFTAPIPINRRRHDSTTTDSSPESTSCSSSSSLQSNLSLQTHPSVTSLNRRRHLSPENQSIAVNYRFVSSLHPNTLPISALGLHSGLLFAASGHRIFVYDRNTLSLLHSFAAHDPSSGAVKSIAAVPGGGLLLSAHQDSKIRLWEPKTTAFHETGHKFLTALPTVTDRLRRFALPGNYTAVRRHHRRLWIEHADAVAGLAAGEDLIYSVSWDRTLKIWRRSDLRCLESVNAHDDAVNAVAVSGDGTVYTGSADNRIRVWAKPANEKRHALISTLEKHRSAVNALALSDDGSVLYSGSCDRSVLVWEREDSATYMVVAGALRGHGGAVLGLCHVSGFLFSGSADRTVRMWRRGREGKYCCLAVLEGHVGAVKSVVAVMEGEEHNGVVSVVSGSLDGEVRVWEVSVSNLDNTDLKLN